MPSLESGRPWPLGATLETSGVNFAVFSAHATKIEVCLFDASGLTLHDTVVLPARSGDIWHGFLPEARAGLVYGLRAHGPVAPARGHRFNPVKLLLDPYARSLGGEFRWTEAHLGDVHGNDPEHALDNARDMWKAVVTDDSFDWGDDRAPSVAMADSVLYEINVKGFTRSHPDVPAPARGRFLGLASSAAIAHLTKLGVTAVNLLPVQQHLNEFDLARRGQVNYWGYNTFAYFVPDARFAIEDPVREFKTMVRALHAAGIEVILDIVLNHTAEGDQRGPTLSWRGLDNASWYRLRHEDARFYENHSGTGNTLDTSQPRVMQFVMDVLRFWVVEMRVDGFRFDLASALARGPHGFDPRHALLQAIAQDPALATVKLIAEPWDLGAGGYQLGHFPGRWSEWNDRYRDAARAFWLRKTADRGEFATRLTGSSDLFQPSGRSAVASINFITAHDGFTLRDLVSYNRKRNLANNEDNRDGRDDNTSWNCGIEGETELLAVNALRGRLRRAMLASLCLSRGVPMLLGGEEIGRTQAGNNNAYIHDTELNWFDWAHADGDLLDFTARLIALRRATPLLRRREWLTGEAHEGKARDVVWLCRTGAEMTNAQWGENERFVFGMQLGAHTTQPALLALFNGEVNDCTFPLPAGRWLQHFDTALPTPFSIQGSIIKNAVISLEARSVVLLACVD